MRGLRGAFRLQLQIVAADRGYLNEILANPFFAIIFLGIVRAARREDLTSFAVVAPVLITLWAMSLEISGDIIDSDRGIGILEGVVATSVGLPTVVWGRVLAAERDRGGRDVARGAGGLRGRHRDPPPAGLRRHPRGDRPGYCGDGVRDGGRVRDGPDRPPFPEHDELPCLPAGGRDRAHLVPAGVGAAGEPAHLPLVEC